MRFPDDVQDDVRTRLRRLEGQVRGVQRLLDEGAECADVVTQLAACKGALDRVSFRLVAAGLRYCTSDDDVEMASEEMERLFLKLS
ncbi:MAG: metal-sensitive transcriptional regulator [Actinomycetota bacterium]